MWLVSAAAIFTVNNILLWWAIGQNDSEPKNEHKKSGSW
jgi:hypothetical protein